MTSESDYGMMFEQVCAKHFIDSIVLFRCRLSDSMLKNPFQYSIASLLFVTFLVAVGMTVGPATWFLIALFECFFFVVVLKVLCENIPEPIQRRMAMNGMRADGSGSDKRKKIELLERSRFKQNLMVLILIFFAATNVGLIVLRVDRLFEGETYLVDSPEVQVRPGRKISEAQHAREIGQRALSAHGEFETSPSFAANTRFAILLVAGSIWVVTLVLIPSGYVGMLRTLASNALDRAEEYRVFDHARELELAELEQKVSSS